MKLTIAFVCLVLAVSLARNVIFKGSECTDNGGANKLPNKKGEKIKITTEKDNECAKVTASVQIEKGDIGFYVKVGRYDKDKLDEDITVVV